MILRQYWLLLAGILVLGEGYSAEGETQSETTRASGESSSASKDEGPSVAEVIVEIANDPGAGFGGGR